MSKTNSRPAENKSVRSDYVNLHAGSCELWEILNQSGWIGWEKIRDAWLDARGGREYPLRYNQPAHHIFHCGTRPDVVSNLIIAGLPAHAFEHKFKVEGTIAALCVKARKCDLDPCELKAATDIDPRVWLDLEKNHSSVLYFEGLRIEALELLLDEYPPRGETL